jgi:hypothetical protein
MDARIAWIARGTYHNITVELPAKAELKKYTDFEQTSSQNLFLAKRN